MSSISVNFVFIVSKYDITEYCTLGSLTDTCIYKYRETGHKRTIP
jgi:hypothetical protein